MEVEEKEHTSENIKITGTVIEDSVKFIGAKEGKKAWCSFKLKDDEGNVNSINLFDKAAEVFNNNAEKYSTGILTVEGKPKVGEFRGKSQIDFVGYKFSFVPKLTDDLKESVNSNPVDKKQEVAAVVQGPAGVSTEVRDYTPFNSGAEGVKDTIDVPFTEVGNSDIAKGVEEEFVPKKLELHEFHDDLGKFGETMVNFLGTAGVVAAQYVSLKIKDMKTGATHCEELKVISASDKGVTGKGIRHTFDAGSGKPVAMIGQRNYYLSEPTLLLDGPGGGDGHKHRFLLGPDGEPTTKKIVGIEVKQLGIGQKFYEQAIFYTEKNGFYGMSQDQLKKHIGALVRGKKVYGDWIRVVKGEKVPFKGAIELDTDLYTGRQITKQWEKNEKLAMVEGMVTPIGGQNVPLEISKEMWTELLERPEGIKVSFGRIEKNGEGEVVGCRCINKAGESILLTGRVGVGILRIDHQLNQLMFDELPKEVVVKQLVSNAVVDAVVVPNVEPKSEKKIVKGPKLKVS